MVADWSQLPFELIFHVAEKFKSPEHIIVFSLVCYDWEDVFSVIKDKWNSDIPWIMLPESGEDIRKIDRCISEESSSLNLIVNNKHPHQTGKPCECIRRFYDPLSSKLYHLNLPEMCSRKCFCSPYGWVLAIGLDLHIDLFNPFTKSHLSLPPQWTLPDPDIADSLSEYERVWIRTCHIEKGIVLKLPDERFVAMVVRGHDGSLALAKPGDYTWTHVKTNTNGAVADVVYWKDKFLILHRCGNISYFDYFESLSSKSTVVESKVYQISASEPREEARLACHALSKVYMLEAHDNL